MRLRVAMLMLLTGCSLIRTRDPGPNYRPTVDPECSEANTPPVVDAVFAAVSGLAIVSGGLLIASSSASNPPTSPTSGIASVATGVGGAALFGVSSGVGFSRVNACRDAWESRKAHLAQSRDAEKAERVARVAAMEAAAAEAKAAEAARIAAMPVMRGRLRLTNRLPEIIVSVSVEAPSSRTSAWAATERRLLTGETHEGAFEIRASSTDLVLVSGVVTYLGQLHRLQTYVTATDGGVVDVVLDFDTALGTLRLGPP